MTSVMYYCKYRFNKNLQLSKAYPFQQQAAAGLRLRSRTRQNSPSLTLSTSFFLSSMAYCTAKEQAAQLQLTK